MFAIFKGFLIGFLIAVPTGPVGFLCLKRALTRPWRESVISAWGSVSADLIFGSVAIFGITTVSHFFIAEQNTIKFFGGLLLLYVGIRTYFNIPPTIIPGMESHEEIGNFASTFSLTMTNPVQIITLPFVFASIGTSVEPGNYGKAFLFMVGVAAGSSLLWFILIAVAGSFKKRIKSEHFLLINRIAGTLITATGIYVLGSLLM